MGLNQPSKQELGDDKSKTYSAHMALIALRSPTHSVQDRRSPCQDVVVPNTDLSRVPSGIFGLQKSLWLLAATWHRWTYTPALLRQPLRVRDGQEALRRRVRRDLPVRDTGRQQGDMDCLSLVSFFQELSHQQVRGCLQIVYTESTGSRS